MISVSQSKDRINFLLREIASHSLLQLLQGDLTITISIELLKGCPGVLYVTETLSEFDKSVSAGGDALIKFRKGFSDVKNARATFKKFDTDGDGEITLQELKKGMGSNFSEQEVNSVFALGDTDHDGTISFVEFAKLMIPSAGDVLSKFWKCYRDTKSVKTAFKQFDTDNDGKISVQEVIQGMKTTGRNFSQAEIDTLFVLADRDGDGAIDIVEFALVMIPTATERIGKLKKILDTKQKVENAFNKFDSNNDGAIDAGEMKAGIKGADIDITDQEVETIFAVADIDGDGQVSLPEFVQLLCPGSAPSGAPAKAAAQTGGNANAVLNKYRAAYKNIDQVREAFFKYDAN